MMRRIQRDIGSLTRCTYLPASRRKTEHRRCQPFQRVSKDRDSPNITRANEACDEWLRTGRQAAVVEATILPAIAAVAVVLASLSGRPLSQVGATRWHRRTRAA